MSSKPRLIKSFENIDSKIKEQIKLAYPFGFANNLITFKNSKNELISALPFETDDYYYLIKMTNKQAFAIIGDDDDYDDDGVLKTSIKEDYSEKYSDIDYMQEYIEQEDGDDE